MPLSDMRSPITAVAPATDSPPFLLVVRSVDELMQQAPAALDACENSGRALILVLAQPRPLLTIDAAVVARQRRARQEELAQFAEAACAMVQGRRVTCIVRSLRYRPAGLVCADDLAKRIARFAADMQADIYVRPAPRPVVAASTEATAVSDVCSTDDLERPKVAVVAAVIPDSLDAVAIAQRAGRVAKERGLRLQLLVPVVARPQLLDHAMQAAELACQDAAVAATSARARPTLERLGVLAGVSAVRHAGRYDRDVPPAVAGAVSELAPVLLIVPHGMRASLRQEALDVVVEEVGVGAPSPSHRERAAAADGSPAAPEAVC